MGTVRFGAPRDLLLWVRNELGVRVFVETGTNRAETTVWASDHFDRVVTIEGQGELVTAARAKHGARSNIEFLHGDSRTALGPVVDALREPAALWLDAHWCGMGTFGPTSECPVLDELAAVNRSDIEHVVLIDDARFFTGPPPPPHKQSEWPDLMQITRALGEGKAPRYAALHEDVIVAVPLAARDGLNAFILGAQARAAAPARASLPRRIARRVLNR
jgi:hypothetical protein